MIQIRAVFYDDKKGKNGVYLTPSTKETIHMNKHVPVVLVLVMTSMALFFSLPLQAEECPQDFQWNGSACIPSNTDPYPETADEDVETEQEEEETEVPDEDGDDAEEDDDSDDEITE